MRFSVYAYIVSNHIKLFQFSLWDSAINCQHYVMSRYLSILFMRFPQTGPPAWPHARGLSILFMRFGLNTGVMIYPALSRFQFSLWDSAGKFIFCTASHCFFQFSLWDSSNEIVIESSNNSNKLSILFMRFYTEWGCISSISCSLSILFMRFVNKFLTNHFRQKIFQFSLWDSM